MRDVKNRPITTLFLIQSLDGKISTGDTDGLDVDKDFPRIGGVREGLYQYYDLEQQTDRVSMNSGRVMAKVGVNTRNHGDIAKTDVRFVIVDNAPHLDRNGCEYFAKRASILYVITTSKNHPAFSLHQFYSNIRILFYDTHIDLVDAFGRLKEEFAIERMTIQTGSTLNAHLLRLNLIDHISLVIAPCLIGGRNTSSLIGGEALHNQEDLKHIKGLRLTQCEVLEHSYLHLRYDVLNETVISASITP